MSDWISQPIPAVSAAVAGDTARLPVRRIFCVGRNYAAHAIEMGRDPEREPPFFFCKPADSLVPDGGEVPYPPQTRNFHHEIEFVVAIGLEGFDIPVERARDHVFGYAVGNDLTRRDLQLDARDKGRPWDWGKAFDESAVISPIRRASEIGHPERGRIWLAVNGEVRQDQDIVDLIWSVPEIISILSRSMRIKPGDLVYTGTPAGVGPMMPGDRITGGIEGVGDHSMTVIAARA